MADPSSADPLQPAGAASHEQAAAPVRPRQPWLHDLLVAVDGCSTVLSGWDADIVPGGVSGLYVDDERVLSTLRVEVADEQPTAVVAEARGATALFLGSARAVGDVGSDPTVEVRRRRLLDGPRMTESVTVTSRAAEPVRTTVRVVLGCDGADLAPVRYGAVGQPGLAPRREGDGVVFDASRHAVAVRFDPPARRLEVAGDHVVAEHDVVVEPGGSAEVTLVVEAARTTTSAFDADAGSDAVTWGEVVVEADERRLAPLVRQSFDDLRHLLQRDPLDLTDVFAAAGSPWYLTLFGRDSLWTARMMLPFGTELAGGTLRALARRQGTRHDPQSAEQPGKIPHEARRTAYDGSAAGLQLPPLYYGTVDATALWVTLLVEAWRWGLPEAQVRALLPHLGAALEWLVGDGQPGGRGLFTYVDETGHGLANQGWKDSADSMRFRDGSIAQGPIALLEAQAYGVQALHGAADLLHALGEGDGAGWRAEGEALAQRVRDRFWVDGADGPYLAMALDRDDRPVDGLGSNMGHVLGTGVLGAGDVDRVAATLTRPELLDRYGLRTLSSTTGGYNPIGYHTGSIWTHDTAIVALGLTREGRGVEAGLLAQALVESGEVFGYRWPELYSGEPGLDRPAPYPASCRPQAWSAAAAGALVTTALGLDADVPAGVLRVRPPATAPFGAFRVDGLRWGTSAFSVGVDREGVVAVEGLPDSVTVDAGA